MASGNNNNNNNNDTEKKQANAFARKISAPLRQRLLLLLPLPPLPPRRRQPLSPTKLLYSATRLCFRITVAIAAAAVVVSSRRRYRCL